MTNPTQSALDALSEKATQAERDCPANKRHLGDRKCPDCGAGPDQSCPKQNVANYALLAGFKEALRTGHLTVADPAAIAAAEARGFERGIREAARVCAAMLSWKEHDAILAKLEGGQ